jgi:hypothetical protein
LSDAELDEHREEIADAFCACAAHSGFALACSVHEIAGVTMYEARWATVGDGAGDLGIARRATNPEDARLLGCGALLESDAFHQVVARAAADDCSTGQSH